MQAANPQVVENLQTAAQMLSHLASQYQVDGRQLKAMGLKWLARHVKTWHCGIQHHLKKVIDRILYFDADPDYDIGSVSGTDTVDGLLARAQGLVAAALDQFKAFRKSAWDAEADYTPDVYEHAIEELERQAYKLDRERSLIKQLGEPSYIGARLEDE